MFCFHPVKTKSTEFMYYMKVSEHRWNTRTWFPALRNTVFRSRKFRTTVLTGTEIGYADWLNTMFERLSFNSLSLTLQLRVLNRKTNRAVPPATCHSFIFPPHPPCCRLFWWHTSSPVPEDIVGLIMRWHESWRKADATNTHTHTHSHAGTDTCTQTHTGIQWSYILAQESTYISIHACV